MADGEALTDNRARKRISRDQRDGKQSRIIGAPDRQLHIGDGKYRVPGKRKGTGSSDIQLSTPDA